MELSFPKRGKHNGFRSGEQPRDTTRDLNNMRLYWQGRACGGQRPGLDKWGAGIQIGAAEQPVVAIASISSVA